MRKTLVAALAVLTMGAVAFAGGAVAPVETEVVVEDNSGAYIGLGYSFNTYEVSEANYGLTMSDSVDFDRVAIQGGYNFNEFVAAEARYTVGVENNYLTRGFTTDASVDTFAVYVKPQYPVSDAVSVYGLLGYAWSTGYETGFADVDFDGFAYGVGAKYAVTDAVEIFADYTSVYSDTETYLTNVSAIDVDEDLYDVTVGVSYRF